MEKARTQILPYKVKKKYNPDDTLILIRWDAFWTADFETCEKIIFCYFQSQSLWKNFTVATGNEYSSSLLSLLMCTIGERTKIIEKHNISLKWLFDKPSNILYELHAAWQMIDGCFRFVCLFFFWKGGQSTTLFWTEQIKFKENTWDCE